MLRFGDSELCLRSRYMHRKINEKLRPKGVAMYAYSVSAYYSYTGSQFNLEQFEKNANSPELRLELLLRCLRGLKRESTFV